MENETTISDSNASIKAAKSYNFDLKNNPFPGLRSFKSNESHLFFGREKQVDELKKKLISTRFLTLIGEVGSGKSSLVNAGIIPALNDRNTDSSTPKWQIISLSPSHDPIRNLAQAISNTFNVNAADNEVYSLQSLLRKNDQGLLDILKGKESSENILIFVDQFEEILSLSRLEKNNHQVYRDSISFINLLVNATKDKSVPIYLILALRSDFLGDCTEFRGLPELINEGQYLIPRMSREDIFAAITKPLALRNTQITQRLEKLVLNEISTAEDQLPLLQQAMHSTWDYWFTHATTAELIDISHYNAVGGVNSGISQLAESAYSELVSSRNMITCDLLLVALTRRLTNDRQIGVEATIIELCELTKSSPEEVIEVVSKFKKPGRDLLLFNVNPKAPSESTVSICHESLMFHWVRFKALLEEERNSAEIYLKIIKAAHLYEKGAGPLWKDSELIHALAWKHANRPNAAWGHRYHPDFENAMVFLNLSKKQVDEGTKTVEKEQVKQHTKNYLLIYAVVAFVVIIMALIFYLLK